MTEGEKNRSVAATAMNARSSRSHLLVTIFIASHHRITKVQSMSKLSLVDLAGSERVLRSEAKGPRLVEAAAINKSLSALGQVFAALKANSIHVPYRNSKLTHILQVGSAHLVPDGIRQSFSLPFDGLFTCKHCSY